jgi:CheY-like chemotaxis protein
MSEEQKTLQDKLIEINNHSKKNILYAEDDKINVFVMERVLKPLGFNLEIAENGSIAVELCKQKKYDVILMDIYMPIMNGFEASKLIKEFSPETPIIAVTAGVFNEESIRKEYGIDHLVHKPVEVFKLINLLYNYLK